MKRGSLGGAVRGLAAAVGRIRAGAGEGGARIYHAGMACGHSHVRDIIGAYCYKPRFGREWSNVKLAVWNCHQALHRNDKWEALTALRADIAVVPECANPSRPEMKKFVEGTRSRAWVGPNETKGLSVVSFGEYEVTPLPRSASDMPDALAVRVVGPCAEFVLMGIWARGPTHEKNLHAVVDRYELLLRSNEVVLAGDFNSNTMWDYKHGSNSHSRLVQRLAALGLVSAYHAARSVAHGSEKEKTLYWRGNAEQSYHVDYVFLPRDWLPRLRTCSVGDPAKWLPLSDHAALVVELDDASAEYASG
jgi:endonuclease/exonuclease/phosphatase family metal-dependent hydrolase